jgi:tungstate transport system substrate-binding protein
LDRLIPLFEAQTGYRVKSIAVGTGQALAMGERGEADVLLVHAPEAELRIVAAGAAINRTLVMHNDLIIVGPPNDPAGVRVTTTAVAALAQVARTPSSFVSRGDQSGTHQMELALWAVAGVEPEGDWYLESGSGMGQTLRIASERRGYTLTDRATYLAHRKNLESVVVLEGDAPLLNIYHVMAVNPERFAKVNSEGAKAFIAFLVAPATQAVIGQFGVDKYGEALFVPDAGRTVEELQRGR